MGGVGLSPEAARADEPVARGGATTVFVSARRLNLRAGPSAKAASLGQLSQGDRLLVVTPGDEWVQVETSPARLRGWVVLKYLSDRRPGLSAAKVRRVLIQQSIESYPGPCACPYNTDRIGRSCGRRSAWSKDGGYAPLCYPDDVSAEAVAAYLEDFGGGE